MDTTSTIESQVCVYGADWCEDTKATRSQLERLGVKYEYINIDSEPEAAQWVRKQNAGKQKTPTLDVAGLILTEPDEQELREALAIYKLAPPPNPP